MSTHLSLLLAFAGLMTASCDVHGSVSAAERSFTAKAAADPPPAEESFAPLPPAPEGKRRAGKYSWESAHAKATATGGLEWAPQPFVFEAGASLRYIDYEIGDDRHSGRSKALPWKHHPWDPNATGAAAAGTGIHTYVFKRGSIYRGSMTVRESGEPGNPIRLTADPSWGQGGAVICGSARLAGGWTQGAAHQDIPAAGKVWYRDLDFAPRTLWMVKGNKVTRIPLARMPNWKISNPEDIKSEWWSWDYPGNKSFDVFMKNDQGRELALGIDTRHLTGPKEFYLGAIAWAEFGWVDGTPYPSFVQGFDAGKKGIGFEGYLGNARSRRIARHHRYYLEDKPHYLDDPEGEFWFEKQGGGGRLYVLLPGGTDPNTVALEAGRESTLIHMEEKRHIAISGLSFRFTNVSWNLTELPWGPNYVLKKQVYPACIRVWGGGFDLNVTHCTFNHVNAGVFMKAVKAGLPLDHVTVTDCDIRETDHGGITIQEGIQWGDALPDAAGHLLDVKILRNYIRHAGQRAMRVGSPNAIDVANGETVEIAGNIIDRPWHAGVNVHCAKISGNGRNQYAVCPNSVLSQSFAYTIRFKWDASGRQETRQVTGRDFKSPQVYDTNFLIEAYFRTEPGSTGGVLAEKLSGAGYSLAVNASGGVTFAVTSGGEAVMLRSGVAINDGRWHHLIVEADRAARTLTLYINGRKDREGPGIGSDRSLENSGDLHVGGTPAGRCFNGTIDFLRICLGTLADAKTDIDELYAWQFSGPFLRDFAGREPRGRRDAGALEKTD